MLEAVALGLIDAVGDNGLETTAIDFALGLVYQTQVSIPLKQSFLKNQ